MGWNDHLLDDSITKNEICPYCGKEFECTYSGQVPGFRFSDLKTCPYCGKVIDRSMEYEFVTRKLEVDKEKLKNGR